MPRTGTPRSALFAAAFAAFVGWMDAPVHAAPPTGAVAEVVAEGVWGLAGVVPLQDGRLIAWQREGRLWMSVDLVVSDPLGLTATDSVRLHPDCAGILACRADLNVDRRVDGQDLAAMLQFWGASAAQRWQADLDGDGTIGGGDLAQLLNHWGPCPPP